MPPRTSSRTLYRLQGVQPTVDAMFDALDEARLLDTAADFRVIETLGVPALGVTGRFEHDLAPWCPDFARLTDWLVSHPDYRGAAALFLAIDGEVYAVGFGAGFRLVPDQYKDRRFGLRYVIRTVNPDVISGLVTHRPGQGRTDATMVPGGAPLAALRIEEYHQLVRRLRGHSSDDRLTGPRGRLADGGCGLRLSLGADPETLVADIGEIGRVIRDESPDPRFAFVENLAPVEDRAGIAELDGRLDDMLGELGTPRATIAVPTERWSDYERAKAFGVRVNSTEERTSTELDLDYLLHRTRVQRQGRRVTALREGIVSLYAHERAAPSDRLTRDRALRWLEAEIGLGPRRFFLLEEDWYEADQAYLASIEAAVCRLIPPVPSLDLPAWPEGNDEKDYNRLVPVERPGFVCLDRDNVRTRLHRGNGVEVCDLLAPDGTLVMVKQASGSGPLSHLFNQGVVAVQTLLNSPEAREGFAHKAAAVPVDYRPKKVVFAILLKSRANLTPNTLYPFSQITLVHTARTLESWGVSVEVIGIPRADAVEGEAARRHVA
ncbi:DUF6119 family protein [Streptomyces sp. B6B3]|uniref:TIGR04141 family sporadically distributed protein n=1 Tax=Streptomyces sp. B6B3 TaxID=3153570 RepID=UPI00325D98EA